mmetsp:Transcript_5864/g.9003  ORF Transcript_5864/g.9003 Transcript_5864/m.9003 type:complete len:215 (-) Transcript_5864:676-1320(-)
MKDDIHEVETATTHSFLSQRSVLGSPGETSNNRLLNFKQVVDSLCGINEKVRSSSLRSESPDLTGLRNIPAELISELTALELRISTRVDITIINSVTELGTNGVSLNEKTVVLVSRLGKTSLVGLSSTCLTEGNNGIRDLDLSSHEVLLKILQANLQVQFTGSSNNVLSRLVGVTQNHRIGLSETLHSLNKLGKIGGVLWLNGTTHNGRYGELH